MYRPTQCSITLAFQICPIQTGIFTPESNEVHANMPCLRVQNHHNPMGVRMLLDCRSNAKPLQYGKPSLFLPVFIYQGI
jgi:hypothetical protein